MVTPRRGAFNDSIDMSARFGACVLGIIISLVGILGVLNGFHQANAIWKKVKAKETRDESLETD